MLAQLLLSGLLLGCIYALISMGLTLIYGVMRIVNFAHGAFVMIAMYLAYWASTWFRLDPVLFTPIAALILFVLGMITYRLIISRIVEGPYVSRLLATFGLSFVLVSTAHFLWSPTFRFIQHSVVQGTLKLGGLFVELPKLVASGGSVIVAALIYWFIRKTRTGQAIQAISTDRMGAALMGIPLENIMAISFGIGIACAGAAGSLLSTFYYIFPDVASLFGMIALVAVALGGFGSIEGAFVGALILGVGETLGGFVIGGTYKYAIMFLLYVGIVLIRPQGLLGQGKT